MTLLEINQHSTSARCQDDVEHLNMKHYISLHFSKERIALEK